MLRAYREYRPPAGLEAVVACVWEHQPAEARAQRVVPDGCVDLIWLAGRELVIAGADTGPRSVELSAQARSSGIRLRRVLAAVGYGPKMLVRVARLRRLVALSGDSLASRALEAGYASQAHMNDEVRRLTGTTPVRFLKDAALTAA
jgi:methylphosphotriester-DNA--protein-cysteine methyltransferase